MTTSSSLTGSTPLRIRPSLVLVILVVISLIASATAYVLLAQKTFADGLVAYETSDWLSAYDHFAWVTGFYKFGVPDRLNEAQVLQAKTSLLSYAEDRHNQKDFEAALTAYATYLHAYPASTNSAQMEEQAGATYVEWITTLQANQEYAEAEEKYLELITAYPDSNAAKSADELAASIYWTWANALHQQSEFELEIQKLKVIQSAYTQTSYSPQVHQRLAEVYALWTQNLAAAGDFATAVENYNVLRTNFAEQPTAQATETALAVLYKGWADSLNRAGDYAAAIEKYDILIRDFADQPETQGAELALAETELRYATQLWETQQPTLAVVYASHGLDIFENLLVTAPESVTTEQSALIRQAYQKLGQQLLDEGRYIGAMELYTSAEKFAANLASPADWQAAFDVAAQALSADSGVDGRRVIDGAIETACQGQPTNWSVVGVSEQVIGARLCPGGADVNLEGPEAFTPGSLHYVVKAESTSSIISSCAYSGAHVLHRARLEVKITIYDAATGTVVQQTAVGGPLPPSCPGSYSFPSTFASSATISGESPTPEAVQQTLTQLLAELR